MTNLREQKKLKLCAELCVARGFGLALALVGVREDAEDIIQEALLIATRKVATLPRRPWPWLATTITHLARNRWHKAQRRGPSLPLLDHEVATQSTPLAAAISEEMRGQLREALASLDAKEREAIALVHVAGFTQRQAARQQGRPFTSFQRDLASAIAKVEAKINLPSKTLLAAFPALALAPLTNSFAASISSAGMPALSISAAAATSGGAAFTTLTIGGIFMKKSIVIVTLLLLLLGGTATVYLLRDDAPVNPLTTSKRDQVSTQTKTKAVVDATPLLTPIPIIEEGSTEKAPPEVVEAAPSPIVEEVEAKEEVAKGPTTLLIVLNEDGSPASGLFVSWDGPKGKSRAKSPNRDGHISFNKSDGIDEASEFIIERSGYDKERFKHEDVATQTIVLKEGNPSITFKFAIIQSNGQTFPNGYVTLYHSRDQRRLADLGAGIDAEGRITIELHSAVNPRDVFHAVFSLSAHSGESLATRELSMQDAAPNVVVMEATAPLLVRGRVVDESGLGLAGMNLDSAAFYGMANDAKKWQPTSTARCSAHGYFLLALPSVTRVRLGTHYAAYNETTNAPRECRLNEVFRIPAGVSVYDLGDVVPLEVANISVVVTQGGERVSGLRAEFKIGNERVAESKTNNLGKVLDTTLTKRAIRTSTDPLMVRISGGELFIDWTDIKDAALEGKTVTLEAIPQAMGNLKIALSAEDNEKLRLGIDAYFWRHADFGGDVICKMTLPKSAGPYENIRLPAGNYYGFIQSRNFAFQRRSKVIEFVVIESNTTTISPACPQLASLTCSTLPAYKHRLSYEIRYDRVILNLADPITVESVVEGVELFHFFADEPAQLIINLTNEAGDQSRARSVKLPEASLGQRVELKIKDEISAMLTELGDD